MLSTWLTEILNLRVPIIGAPMIGAAGPALATAVSQAGALGMVGMSPVADLDQLEGDLAELTASGLPFGIGLLGWSTQRRPELLDAAIRLRPALISVSFGDYLPALGPVQEAGILLATQVGDAAGAGEAAGRGVDLLVARGGEGGGHGLNEVATLPLLQAVLDEVTVPVVAAGGIGTARGLAAVLAAGAAGAWVGTALLACIEAETSEAAKARVLAAGATDTVYTTAFDRALGLPWPERIGGRALRNRFSDSWAGREGEVADHPEAREELTRAWPTGDVDVLPVYAGQGVGSVTNARPAGEVIGQMAEGAEALLGRWAR